MITSTVIAVIMPIRVAEAETLWERVVGIVQGVFRIETERNDVTDGLIFEKNYSGIEDFIEDGYHIYYPTFLPEGFSLNNIVLSEYGHMTRVKLVFINGDAVLHSTQGFGAEMQIIEMPSSAEETIPITWNNMEGEYWEENGVHNFRANTSLLCALLAAKSVGLVPCAFHSIAFAPYPHPLFILRGADRTSHHVYCTTPVREQLKLGVDISERIKPEWEILPKRWIVERTLSWLGHSRRLSKDYEIRTSSAVTMIHISHLHTLLRRF